MTHVSRTVLIPYTAEQMFDVVNDVRSYSEFLPGCESSEVLSESESEMKASLTIVKGSVRKSFTTRGQLNRPESIRLALVEGPFSEFSGLWTFKSIGDGAEKGCRVNIEMDFSFDSFLLNMTLGRAFSSITDKLIDAFCERAEKLYG